MNKFAKLVRFPLTADDCERESHAMQQIFDASWNRDCVREIFELSMHRHFGSPLSVNQDRIALAIRLALKNVCQDMGWHRPLMHGLVVFLLYGSDEEIQQFCRNYPVDLDPGMTTPLEYQIPQIYLLVCNELNEHHESSEGLEEAIAKCRKKAPVQYLKVFQAAIRGSQAEYDEALTKGLQFFRELSTEYLDATISFYICKELSVINMMALRKGKVQPRLPDELAACLMTPDSVLGS